MPNTLKLTKLDDDRIRTETDMIDNFSIMQIHNPKLNDERVLLKIMNDPYYTNATGDWVIHLVDDDQKFESIDLKAAIRKAILFINDRDNPLVYVLDSF